MQYTIYPVDLLLTVIMLPLQKVSDVRPILRAKFRLHENVAAAGQPFQYQPLP